MPVWLSLCFLSFLKQSSSIFWILPFPRDLLPPLERTLCLPSSSPPHVLNGGLSTLTEQTCPQGSGPWLRHSVWPLPGRQAGPHPSPSLPCQPQLLTGPLAPKRPSPRCPHTAGGCGWRSGPARSFSGERPPHKPLCGVVELLAQLCPPPSVVQNTALVTPTTKGPYFPSSFIRVSFGLTGSGSEDLDKNKAALLLTLRTQ